VSYKQLIALQEDPAAILDIKEDIREECAKLGEVTNVALFDKETDGIATIKFKEVEAAEACIRVSLQIALNVCSTLMLTFYLIAHERPPFRWTAGGSFHCHRQGEV
jgi:hypothetical protein